MSLIRSILLFEGAPSVPIETGIPFSNISGIDANPRTTFMAAAGLWETFTSCNLNKSISLWVSQTVWAAKRFGPNTPSLSRYSTVPTPLFCFTNEISSAISAICICIPVLYLSASSLVLTSNSSVVLKIVLNANHILILSLDVLLNLWNKSNWVLISSSVVFCHASGRPSPVSITDLAKQALSPVLSTASTIASTYWPPDSKNVVTPDFINSTQHAVDEIKESS